MVSKIQTIYGYHAVLSALRLKPHDAQTFYYLHAKTDDRLKELLTLATEQKLATVACSRDELDQLAQTTKHQGFVLVGQFKDALNEDDLFHLLTQLSHPPLILILEGLEDPHNLGACLRVADGAGVDAVVLPKNRGVSVTAAVKKVSAGASDALPLFEISNLARVIEKLKDAGVWCAGTAGEATQTVYEADLKGPLAIVMGNEGQGLRRLTKEKCDFLMKIPMNGYVTSLNVSVATGVVLYEAVRQRS